LEFRVNVVPPTAVTYYDEAGQAHGPYSDAIYADLKKSVATLLEESSTPLPKATTRQKFSGNEIRGA